MSWTLLVLLVLIPGVGVLALFSRRMELRRMRERIEERDLARSRARPETQLQYPEIDLSRCLGCATCVASCPEAGVLDIVHGQAMVVDAGRCAGVSACERECPVDAITVTIANLEQRTDVPALTAGLEATGSPGLFLAGEVTAHALVKRAVDHGTAVALEVARRKDLETAEAATDDGVLDLCIVGAGPAGLACALEATRLGLRFAFLDQEDSPGGTVAKYPRRKLVLTEPLELPLAGRLRRTSYLKEELVDLWQRLVEQHGLPFEGGVRLEGVERLAGGGFEVMTSTGVQRARNVCLALGRRGTPNRLGVPGEQLPKVAYSLLDAQSYRELRVAVVGGGDSALEAALALAEQPGNQVTLVHRGADLNRARSANRERLERAQHEGRVRLLLGTTVSSIRADALELVADAQSATATATATAPATDSATATATDSAPATAPATATATATATDSATATASPTPNLHAFLLPNDELFVMVGGTPPFELLGRAGVSFDPADRPAAEPILEQGSGLLKALAAAGALALCALLFTTWNADYYLLPRDIRPEHGKHQMLRPSLGFGLWAGLVSVGLILVNLLYLVRRAPWGFRLGSLKAWMSSHVATGVLALLCAMLHAGMSPRNTVGGHAFWALAVLLVTGGIGRYLYAWVPRAANGRELELSELKARLEDDNASWSGGERRFRDGARHDVLQLLAKRQWSSSFAGRFLAMLGVRRDLKRVLRGLEARGREEGVDAIAVDEALQLARRAHRSALMAAHYEDLRGLLATWRYLHRWVALLMVVLLALHVVFALKYGSFFLDESSFAEPLG